MTTIELYNELSFECSKRTTEKYSTSFASSIRLLHKDLHAPVHSIYGFVRLADEIVDTFHGHDKITLLQEFKQETYNAIGRKISLNPILHSFQSTVHQFSIDTELIDAFFKSMAYDLDKKEYSAEGYNEYIYGSAEVVGLMCLRVFCGGCTHMYKQLTPFARKLGAAFQKVNFLRDIKADFEQLERMYFPGCDFSDFSDRQKAEIEADIQQDFEDAYKGILQLPPKARFGVYVAYKYYLSLFKKIKRIPPKKILQQRIRIPNYSKAMILAKAGVRSQLNLL